MKRIISILSGLPIVLVPALALANAPPNVQAGGSPEPAAALLLALGSIPAYVIYRRKLAKRNRESEPGR